jgi:hypothetical protein
MSDERRRRDERTQAVDEIEAIHHAETALQKESQLVMA